MRIILKDININAHGSKILISFPWKYFRQHFNNVYTSVENKPFCGTLCLHGLTDHIG